MKLKSYLRGLGTGLFISAVLMGIAVSGKTKELSDAEIRTRAKALGMIEEDSVLVKPAEEAPAVEDPEEKPEVPKVEEEVKEEAEASDKKEETETGRKDTGVAVLEEDPEPVSEPSGEESSDTGEKAKAEDLGSDETGKAANEASADKSGSDEIRNSKEDMAMGGQSEKKSENDKVSGLQNSSKDLGYNEFFTIQIASGSSSETVSRLLKSGGAIDSADDFDDYLCRNHFDKKITPGVFKIPVGADYQQIAEIITGGK